MPDLDQKSVLNSFDYNPIDGSLIRRVSSGNVKPGSVAGYLNPDGYVYAKLGNVRCGCHRIIWIFHYGEIPDGMRIDHINGIRSDNRIDNIRLVTSAENSKNMAKGKNNTSGFRGVVWCKKKKKWMVRFKINKKVSHFGYFYDINEAAAVARTNMSNAGFTSRHIGGL